MTLGLPSHGSEILLLLSLYLFFLLSGLVDVVVFYCGYSILPEGIQSFILTLAFAMEAVIFHAISPTSAHHLVLLLFVILACALASILEVIFENKLVKFCRTFFTMLQVHGYNKRTQNPHQHSSGHMADTPGSSSIKHSTTHSSSIIILVAPRKPLLSPPSYTPSLLSVQKLSQSPG